MKNLHVALPTPVKCSSSFSIVHTQTRYKSLKLACADDCMDGWDESVKRTIRPFDKPSHRVSTQNQILQFYFILFVYEFFFWRNKRQLHQWRKGEGEEGIVIGKSASSFFTSTSLTRECVCWCKATPWKKIRSSKLIRVSTKEIIELHLIRMKTHTNEDQHLAAARD